MKVPKASHLQVLFLSACLTSLALAQNPTPAAHDPTAEDSTTTDAQSTAPALTPEQVALIERYLTTVRAQPVGKLDTRSAAAGQGITLQIIQDATLANGTRLAKGTKLTGRILRAQAWQQGGAAALLSIQIDRAVLGDGSSIPVRCVLRAVVATGPSGGDTGVLDASQQGSRPRRGSNSSSMGGPTSGAIPLGNPTPMGGGMGDPSGGDIGNSPMGGGGASSGGYPGGSGNPTSNPNSSATRGGIGGGGIGTGDPGIGGSTGRIAIPNATAVASANPELPVTAAGESIHDTPHPTGLPGVLLSGASVAGVSGTLSAYERNFTLDSNSQLTLGVISAK